MSKLFTIVSLFLLISQGAGAYAGCYDSMCSLKPGMTIIDEIGRSGTVVGIASKFNGEPIEGADVKFKNSDGSSFVRQLTLLDLVNRCPQAWRQHETSTCDLRPSAKATVDEWTIEAPQKQLTPNFWEAQPDGAPISDAWTEQRGGAGL